MINLSVVTTKKSLVARIALIAAVSLASVCLLVLSGVGATEPTLAASYEYSPATNSIAHSAEVTETSTSIAEPETDTPATATEDVNTSGPLATMQTRLAGNESQGETLFCFAETGALIVPIEDPAPGLAVVQLSVMFNGSYSFLALQNGQYLLFAAGGGSSDGMFETAPFGISDLSTSLPPYLVTLTDTSISFGPDSTLPLVSCTDVEAQIQIMRTKIEQAEAEGRFERPRAETPAEDAPEVETESARIPDDQVLSSAGLGPIRVGLLVSELETHLGVEIDFITIDGDLSVPGDCGSVQSTLDLDVDVLVELTGGGDAIVRRVSTTSDRWATPSGIRVGSTQQQVIDAFPGQLDIQPHIYAEDGQYLTFIPSDINDPNTVEFVIVFGLVTEIRAGAHRWVSLAESCA